MPFGKHKGEELEDVPTEYLEWALRDGVFRSEALAEEAEAQIRMRGGEGVVRRAGA